MSVMSIPVPSDAPPSPVRAEPAGAARTRLRSTVANARLTGLAGIVLVVLLFAQGLTIPGVRSKLGWHVFIGFLLIPPVLVKLGSTGYRAARYYTGDPAYRAAGPPRPALRFLAPLVVISTVAVLATGVALVAGGHHHGGWLSAAHKMSFLVWFAVMTVHVLAYAARAAGLAWADVTGRGRVRWRAWRLTLVGASLAAGIGLGLAPLGWARHWHGLGR